MYYIIYKTINKVNKKFYIGKHKTETLIFDGYLGSGKLLKNAIKKYGKENFVRETLYIFSSEKEASKKEAEILTVDFLLKNVKICYNLHVGGIGGSGCIVMDKHGNVEFKDSIISDISRKEIGLRIKGTAVYEYPDGKKVRLEKNHHDVISGVATIPKTNSSIYIVDGVKMRLKLDDPRVILGTAIHILKGIKIGNGGFKKENSFYESNDGSVVYLSSEEAKTKKLKNINNGTSVYRYPNGDICRLSKNHPDVLSKVAIGINKDKKLKTTICPQCGQIGSVSNMNRYHFSNCKKLFNLPME